MSIHGVVSITEHSYLGENYTNKTYSAKILHIRTADDYTITLTLFSDEPLVIIQGE